MLSFSLNLLFDSWHSELQFHPVPAKELAPSTGFGSFKELSATTSTTKREGQRDRERERLGETETERGERLRESETERDRDRTIQQLLAPLKTCQWKHTQSYIF